MTVKALPLIAALILMHLPLSAVAAEHIQAAGKCSPVFNQSSVQGNVRITCESSDPAVRRIEQSLNEALKSSRLTRLQISSLLSSINALLEMRPQLERAENNSATAVSLETEILALVQELVKRGRTPDDVLAGVRSLESRTRSRMEPLPKKIDPNDITARISFLYLGELGCPNFDPPIPDNLTPAEYKEELLVAQGSMRKHEYADAIKRLDRLVVSHPNEELPRLKRAAALCQYRRYDQALKTIEELLVQNVRSAQYAVARGQLLFRLRRYEEAARAFHAAAMQSPGSAEYYWGEGDSLRMAHRCATAIEAFTRAIQLDPRYTDAYLSRAECYQQIGKASLALSDISTAILLDTGSVRAHQLLSDTYRIMASDRRLSAQADYRVLADEAERETTELRRLSDNRAKDQQPRLDCGDVEVGDPENERACTRYTFDIYFERGESYLTQKAIGEINGLLPIASSCERMIIRVTGYADPGEDDYSDGKDLASSREQILSWVFMETLGRGGVYELTLLDNYYVDRMSDTDGLIAIYSGSFGYDKRPVRGPTSTVDERNQVAQVVLTCDGRRTTH